MLGVRPKPTMRVRLWERNRCWGMGCGGQWPEIELSQRGKEYESKREEEV